MRGGAAIKRDGEGRDFLGLKKGGAALGNHDQIKLTPPGQGLKVTLTEGGLILPLATF